MAEPRSACKRHWSPWMYGAHCPVRTWFWHAVVEASSRQPLQLVVVQSRMQALVWLQLASTSGEMQVRSPLSSRKSKSKGCKQSLQAGLFESSKLKNESHAAVWAPLVHAEAAFCSSEAEQTFCGTGAVR